jgi:hypothetical protein
MWIGYFSRWNKIFPLRTKRVKDEVMNLLIYL